jgi:uracil-DNA glycosylase
VIDDPAEALDILLEELKRQKAAGLRRVSVSDEAVATLKALAGAPVAAPAPVAVAKPAAIAATAASVRPTPIPVTPKPAAVATTPVIADAPIFTLPAGTKAERMQALRQLVDACVETKKHLTGSHRPLLGHGSLDAKVVFVGDAPSLEEMEAGKVFAGPAGEVFSKILTAAALTESDFYLAAVTVWRPEPPTAYGKRPPTARELAFNLPYLRAQIDVIQPKAVIALGAQAFESLHGRSRSITDARGTWFDLSGVPMMASWHPNYLLHNSNNALKRTFWEDFLQVMEKVGLPITDKQRGFFTSK